MEMNEKINQVTGAKGYSYASESYLEIPVYGERSIRKKIKEIEKNYHDLGSISLRREINEVFKENKHSPIIYVPKNKNEARETKTSALAKWEGVIKSIDKESRTFQAHLKDILYYQKPMIEAEFDFDDIDETKHHLIKEGSIFYWNIFDEKKPYGQKIRGSNQIYFRELPIWKNYDSEASSEISKNYMKELFDE